MKLSLLLHFYQPHNQQPDILLRIVNECYLPLTRGMLEMPNAKFVVNINGALTELLINNGYSEIIENIKTLSQRGQIEFTASAKYHAFLPLLPEEEILRQIELNNETNRHYFGTSFQPTGFFSPEMAINPKVLSVVKKLGFNWLAAPQVSFPSGSLDFGKFYEESNTGLKIMFRNKRISSLILSAVCRDSEDLIRETRDLQENVACWFGVMDAETFGHHRIGHEKFLFDLVSNPFFETETVGNLLKTVTNYEKVSLRPSTWTNDEQDFWVDKERKVSTEAKSFILWKDPENPIHNMQWKLLEYCINEINSFSNKEDPNYTSARQMLDKAESSDQFWWASAKPWWSLEMIEQGAFELKQTILALYPDSDQAKYADMLYRNIIDLAFDWQRTGYIRKRHLANSGTFMKPSLKERTNAEWFNQLILEFEKDMKDAAEKQDFEKAIKWRDAIIKISLGTDKYDVLHVLDELWMGRNAAWATPLVKPFLDHNWDEFSKFAKEHFLNASTKEEFENWKKSRQS